MLCLFPKRAAEMLKAIEKYADSHNIDIFSLDAWRTFTFGGHWSFGLCYTNNEVDWIELMKAHCEDDDHINQYRLLFGSENMDWYFTYLDTLNKVRIATYYVENLRFIHNVSDKVYFQSYFGLCYWKNGRRYIPTMCDEMGLGDKGSLPIASDVIKIDFDLKDKDSEEFFRARIDNPTHLQMYINANTRLVNKELSIIIYARNAGEYIAHCLWCLYQQEAKIFEVILIDDASTDNTLKICQKRLEMFWGRMKIIQNETPRGMVESLNAGLRASDGEYIMFLDCADLLQPDFVKVFCNAADQAQADVLQSTQYFLPPPNVEKYQKGMPLASVLTHKSAPDSVVTMPEDIQNKIKIWKEYFQHTVGSVKLIRREFLFQNKIFFSDKFKGMEQAMFDLQCLLPAKRYSLLSHFSHIHQPRVKSELPAFSVELDPTNNAIKMLFPNK